MKKAIWFVTGASKGLGKTLVKKLLDSDYRVAATSRFASGLIEIFGKESDIFLPLEVQLTDRQSVMQAVSKVEKKWGGIDVLVNNAGYGQFGAVEEVSDREARNNFDINLFGLLNVTRAVLPSMRAQKSGNIFNISSAGGFVGGFPGAGIYCATKFAVAGMSEGLHAELSPLGIHVTIIYPGYFRTSFLSQKSITIPQKTIDDYETAKTLTESHANDIHGNQPGDPEKAAETIINIVEEDAAAPLHLFLGSDAYKLAKKKLIEIDAALEQYKVLTFSTDFDAKANS